MNSEDKKKLWPELGPEADKMLKLARKTMDIVVIYEQLDSEQEERFRKEALRILRHTFLRFDPDDPEKIKGLIYNTLWKWALSYAYKDPDYKFYYDESAKYDEDGRMPEGVLNQSTMPSVDGRHAMICKEQINEFSKAVSKFGKQHRMVVLDRLIGRTYAEIGEKIRVSTGTARKSVRILFNKMIDYFIEIDERTKVEMATKAMR